MTEILTAGNLAVPHGFITRAGGVSPEPFASMNLSLSTGDTPANIEENRVRVLKRFRRGTADLCLLSQVHGDRVVEARPGQPWLEADAFLTLDPGHLLAVSYADCPPVLFHDPRSGAVAAAHCGWRGTVARLAARVVERLAATCGADPAELLVAVGPGICAGCYQVGPELREAFSDARFPASVVRKDPATDGRYLLDLAAANHSVLREAGVAARNIELTRHCTACDSARFFSHRRDKGATGRHWAVIGMAAAPSGSL